MVRLMEPVSVTMRSGRRLFKQTPMHKIMSKVRRHGVDLENIRALELFAGDGTALTADLGRHIRHLELWDINPACEAPLRKCCPHAAIRIVDSLEEIKVVGRRFELIAADAYPWPYGSHYDHFDLFPHVFAALEDRGVLMLNITTDWDLRKMTGSPILSPDGLRQRQEFYDYPEPTQVPLAAMLRAYERLAQASGFRLDWWETQDRYWLFPLKRPFKKWRLQYLAIGVSRNKEVSSS